MRGRNPDGRNYGFGLVGQGLLVLCVPNKWELGAPAAGGGQNRLFLETMGKGVDILMGLVFGCAHKGGNCAEMTAITSLAWPSVNWPWTAAPSSPNSSQLKVAQLAKPKHDSGNLKKYFHFLYLLLLPPNWQICISIKIKPLCPLAITSLNGACSHQCDGLISFGPLGSARMALNLVSQKRKGLFSHIQHLRHSIGSQSIQSNPFGHHPIRAPLSA